MSPVVLVIALVSCTHINSFLRREHERSDKTRIFGLRWITYHQRINPRSGNWTGLSIIQGIRIKYTHLVANKAV